MTNEEFEKAKAEGRAQRVPLDSVFANPIGEVVTEVMDGLDELYGLYEHLDAAGRVIGDSLMAWNDSLPPDERHKTGWVLKKAHDEVNARLHRSIFATLNVNMGFEPDTQP